ncbi:SDR family oxidoreductase [Omnitrophica bacterium]|nr:SDR family oxidoreductase [Candidatus Omnitrophota bacterium]
MSIALITGASQGIGYELAKLFARDGHDLILVARSADKLNAIGDELQRAYSNHVSVIVKDLSLPGAADELFAEVTAQGKQIDFLVNNAGFGLFGLFNETDWEKEAEMMQLNMVCLARLMKLFLKGMVDRGSGRILNIGSTASFQPGPLMAVYYATKSFVLFLGEAVQNELKGTGVTVTTLCPGPTRTGFQEASHLGKVPILKLTMMDAAQVAKAGYRGLMKGKTVLVPGLINKIMVFLVRIGPRSWVTFFVRKLFSS